VRSEHSTPPRGTFLQPDEIVRQLRHLPAAARVLPRLKKLLSDGNSSMPEVVEMIRLDPGIAARVLQMGNSIYYSRGLHCYTVDEAVDRVGYNQIYELVANAVASQVLVRPLTAYGVEAEELWRMSVVCALAAETLARHLRLERDIAYTVGLLHGVGLVAIDEWAFRRQPGLRFAAGALPLETSEAERAALGFHNGEAGAALLHLWEFSPVMSEPIRWQYHPRGAAAHQKFATVLHLAKRLRTAVCTGALEVTKAESGMLDSLGLDGVIFEQVLEKVQAQLQGVRSLLETPSPDRAVLDFPNGERTIEGSGVTRTLMDRYA
jgi:HD-like signal output (HDOD) protein